MARPFAFSYAHNADSRGWGSGWPKCGGASGNIVTVLAGNSGAKFAVHRRISRLVDLLVDECARRGYDFLKAQCGAYNCRPIGGTSKPSNHSWGLALDINWQLNPFVSTLHTNIPVWMRNLFEEYGFAWGGNYSGKKDAMHFEFMGTPAQADQMTDKALRSGLGTGTTVPSPSTSSTLRKGSTDTAAIRRWQQYCNDYYAKFKPPLNVDGDFGDKTVIRTKEIQAFLGIGVDGEVGPTTRSKTGFKG